jgi:hypothetical protein
MFKPTLKNLRYLTFLVWAAVLAGVLAAACTKVNNTYYERWPLQGDTASYWLRDLALLDHAPATSHRTAILDVAKDNHRDPLRTASFALLKPDHILSVNGHLYFSGFAAFLFFATLILCLWTRTRSWLYALGAPVATLLAIGLYDPMYGMPSRLPDMPAALFFGAALFVLFIKDSIVNPKLIFVSGALLGLATLTRYHVWVYGVFVLGPVITIYAIGQFRKNGRLLKDLLIPHIAFIAGLALVAGWFIIGSAADVFSFYMVAGYGLNKTIYAALSTTGMKLFANYFGMPAITTLLLLLTSYVAIGWGGLKKLDVAATLTMLWGALSCLFLILIVMRLEDDVSQTYYMMPGLVLLCLSPFCLTHNSTVPAPGRAFSRFALGLAILLPLSAYGSYTVWIRSEGFIYPRPHAQKIYAFNKELTKLVASTLPPKSDTVPVIDTNFDYYARYIVPELQLHFDRQSRFGNVFQIRQSQWQLSFTGSATEDRARIMPTLNNKIDVFITLSEFDTPDARLLLKDDYTRDLAAYVEGQLKKDTTTWEPRGRVLSPYGGEVTVYLNKVRQRAITNPAKPE